MSPHEATTAKDWKKNKKKLEPVEVPSGKYTVIRRKPLDVFLKAGLIPNDLLPIIQEALKQGKTEITPQEIMGDQKKVVGVLELIDIVCVECLVEPKVLAVPLKEEDRDDDLLYVDELEWEDKQFIYSYAIGSVSDLEAFREEQAGDLEALSNGDVADGETVGAGSDTG